MLRTARSKRMELWAAARSVRRCLYRRREGVRREVSKWQMIFVLWRCKGTTSWHCLCLARSSERFRRKDSALPRKYEDQGANMNAHAL